MRTEPYKNLIDPSEGPVSKRTHALNNLVLHYRAARRKCIARLVRMYALPCVSVTHANFAERLPTRPEAYAGCIRGGIEIARHDHLLIVLRNTLLHKSSCRYRLQFALMFKIQLEVRKVVYE